MYSSVFLFNFGDDKQNSISNFYIMSQNGRFAPFLLKLTALDPRWTQDTFDLMLNS